MECSGAELNIDPTSLLGYFIKYVSFRPKLNGTKNKELDGMRWNGYHHVSLYSNHYLQTQTMESYYLPFHYISYHQSKHILWVTRGLVFEKFRANRDVHFHLSWLRDKYKNMVEHDIYVLHLVICTILADKSHVYIDVTFISLFSNSEHLD